MDISDFSYHYDDDDEDYVAALLVKDCSMLHVFLPGNMQVLPNVDESYKFVHIMLHNTFYDENNDDDDDLNRYADRRQVDSYGQDPETESFRCSGRVRRKQGRVVCHVHHRPEDHPSPSQGTW